MKNISWDEYQQLVDKLAKKINFKKNKFNLIVAINRGGNVVGTMLSHKSKVPLKILHTDEFMWIGKEGDKILLVDDLSDTGKTFIEVLTWFPERIVKTACVHVKDGTKFIPDYFVENTNNDWIVYPYE